ncbi:putative small nuclear ribonucleoprotein E [Lucilia cuprina]|nr:putative small nuclear ribonucleoprotein E [Lucilia cuprina]
MGTRVPPPCPTPLICDGQSVAGLPQLIDDLQRLSEDQDSADVVFICGREEERIYAHRIIMMARCKSFKTNKRGEICRIPGCSVSPAAPGTPTSVRLPHVHPEVLRQFVLYVYTAKILLQDSRVFEMMTLAQDMGCCELRSACEDHVIATLSVDNACTFLTAVMEIHEKAGNTKVQKVMVQPINLIFRYLQNRSRVQVWLYENINLRIEGHIVGFDEYMNLVLDDAEEVWVKTRTRKNLGRIMLKGAKCAASFMERCIIYIGENANECVKTNAFLNLKKEALIKLISSDYFCLEEEDVWRCVLAWAKNHAGVTQPTAHWTEEERGRVCQQLQGVMCHVRLLLIDSQVFAEEVEPTGAVPMELSLERYRYAALQNSNNKPGGHHGGTSMGGGGMGNMGAGGSFSAKIDGDKRLQPRLTINMFPGSQILRNDKLHLQSVLNNWYGCSKQSWRLLYRASTHGFSSTAFHRYCDGIAPCFVICLGSHGEISGGFTDVAWAKTSRKGVYIHSERAFLFALNAGVSESPLKFDIVKKPYAICYHPDCGPIFGAGADLLIANNCNTNKDSYSNLPHSYDGNNASYETLFGDYNFTITDYEVYTVAQASPNINQNPTYSSSSNCLSNTSNSLTNTNGSTGGLNNSNTMMNNNNNNNMGNNTVSLAKAKYERY